MQSLISTKFNGLIKQTTLRTGVICKLYAGGLVEVQTDTYLDCLERGNERKRKEVLTIK